MSASRDKTIKIWELASGLVEFIFKNSYNVMFKKK